MTDRRCAPAANLSGAGSPGLPGARSPGLPGAVLRAIRLGRASPEARANERRERLADLVDFARHRSAFYERRYHGLPERVEDVRRLPPIAKEEAMDAFDDWVTDGRVDRARVEEFMSDPDRVGDLFLGRYLAMRTSGSTGGKAILLHDPGARAAYDAAWAIRGFLRWFGVGEIAGLARRGFRVVEVLATGEHFASFAYSRSGPGGRHPRHRIVSVLDPLHEQVEALNDVRPAVLAAYPSTLVLLARERVAGRLRIDPVMLLSVSECLDSWARSEIEAAFGRPVRNVYAAAEHPALAFDCRQGRLHLADHDLILEPVDDELRPVPPGALSSGALLTNLSNRVQPVIRYLLTDAVLVDPEPCPCGSTLPVIRVEARRRQILTFRDPGGRTVSVAPMALVTVAEGIEGLSRYQLVQRADDRLQVRLRVAGGHPEDAVWSALRDALGRYLSREGLEGVRIDRAEEPPRPDPASGKFHKVWSEEGADWRG